MKDYSRYNCVESYDSFFFFLISCWGYEVDFHFGIGLYGTMMSWYEDDSVG